MIHILQKCGKIIQLGCSVCAYTFSITAAHAAHVAPRRKVIKIHLTEKRAAQSWCTPEEHDTVSISHPYSIPGQLSSTLSVAAGSGMVRTDHAFVVFRSRMAW